MNRIQRDYGSQVLVDWKIYSGNHAPVTSKIRQEYNVSEPNSLIINSTVRIIGDFNATYIREIINAYLSGTQPPPSLSPTPLPAILGLAFSFGFFETFSPCLVVLLSFVLTYSLGRVTQFKDGMLQVASFGIGFVFAALFMGIAVGLVFLYCGTVNSILTWIICIFALVFGFSQLGLFRKASFETKPIVKALSKKYASTYGGLLALGFLFYFLDPCIAPVFFAMLPMLTYEHLSLVLFIFSLGVILPFIIIGLFAGSISKFTRTTYKYKAEIRAISGLILIGYASYLIIFILTKRI
jgi:cytochrome c biogenesis protein CcdA